MKYRTLAKFPIAVCLTAIVLIAGCHKKFAAPAPPPPPPAPKPAPTASITVTPSAIDPGQSATLQWTTSNATSATISGMGAVATSGSDSISPTASTTYTLTARGDGGSVMASARVTVNAPPPPPPAAKPSLTEEQLFEQNMHDMYFDYDKYTLRSEDQAAAQQDAAFLVAHPNMKVIIEGHCDERGSAEYNIALGQERAESLQKVLVNNGVPSSQVRVISYGKEKPFCTDSNEQCWQQNRRDHVRLDR